jgi:hypothetical protein
MEFQVRAPHSLQARRNNPQIFFMDQLSNFVPRQCPTVHRTASHSFVPYHITTTSTDYHHPSSRRTSPHESLFHKPPSYNANPLIGSYNVRAPHGKNCVRPDWHCSSPEASCSHEGGAGERPNANSGSQVFARLEVDNVAAIQVESLRVWSRVAGTG